MHTFRALRHKNFRIYFIGQTISQTGTWVQTVALSWLVFRMTHSPFMLGLVGFANQIPNFIISPFVGVMVDHWNRKIIILVAQLLALLQAALLAWLFFRNQLQIWHILTLSVLLGIVNTIDFTSRQSFFIELVEKKKMLGNAIALNSMIVNLARMIGPSLAGFMIGLVGEGYCFVINAVSYVPVISGMLRIRVKKRRRFRKSPPIFKSLKEGFDYAFGFLPVRSILLLLSSVSMIGMSYIVLMPIFAKTLHGGPKTLGMLMAAVGLGALAGTLAVAARKDMIRLGSIIPLSAWVFAGGLIYFVLTPMRWHAAGYLALAGFGFLIHMTSCNAIIQNIVPDEMRGRVMSFFTMAYMGTAPIGSLISGVLASRIGAPNTLIAGACFCILVALLFSFQIKKLQRKIRSQA